MDPIINFPHYQYPIPIVTRLILTTLSGRRWSFREMAERLVTCQQPGFEIQGRENIPTTGPGVLTFNHYHRPGFQAWWLALTIASLVPVEMHWVVTGELTFPGSRVGFVGRPASRWVLGRLAHTFGFSLMPPMPPRPQDVPARAAAVREVLTIARRTPSLLLGLAPEGGDNPGGGLSRPAAGVGRFGTLLGAAGMEFIPIGAWEKAGVFHMCFGQKYQLRHPTGTTPDEKDRNSADEIMRHIAVLLPKNLRGDYA